MIPILKSFKEYPIKTPVYSKRGLAFVKAQIQKVRSIRVCTEKATNQVTYAGITPGYRENHGFPLRPKKYPYCMPSHIIQVENAPTFPNR